MANTYSSEFGKTLTSGLTALVKGKQNHYVLEHLVGSHYHQSGEKQEIMLDEVILGRDTDCHVRFDESFNTVSRHHASIVRDGDNWRLIQLSKKNTTFLNGKAIQDSWYLQSGDEIQLAVNGPKLIFRIPTETTEFKFNQRLSSFKDQVIKPYQTAFIVVCCVLVLVIAGGITAGVVIKKQSENLQDAKEVIELQRKQIDNLFIQADNMSKRLDDEAARADEAQRKSIAAEQEAFNARKKAIQSEKDMKKLKEQLEELNKDMESFMQGLNKGVNQ